MIVNEFQDNDLLGFVGYFLCYLISWCLLAVFTFMPEPQSQMALRVLFAFQDFLPITIFCVVFPTILVCVHVDLRQYLLHMLKRIC